MEVIKPETRRIISALRYSRQGKLRRHRALLRRSRFRQSRDPDPWISAERFVLGVTGSSSSGRRETSHYVRSPGIREVEPAGYRLQLRYFRGRSFQADRAPATERFLARGIFNGRRRGGALHRQAWIEGRQPCGDHRWRTTVSAEDAGQSTGRR